ncbi:hypothetical protein IEO21_10018 [Rhodonia placenta]|uniref:Uncharacterized protein n=1 Tax=Rhodonia placenta TaxID=104341 RepID=A0A8H7NR82_9APHY|nr:hypothetical protein IEO21_11071 [Postia placenta]KAF9795950.1 hypothetical protein IEO21_11047 [Postia placenta]KAF9797369.1 hypothetical protein IEO21_10876 [Postia placenta]KAF9798059.1 hypothetical protein IEO21_10796 [Postia placenta]KAF9800297.1 hypothetical protein IEO21_10393 [Postia placenta]
MLTRPRGP